MFRALVLVVLLGWVAAGVYVGWLFQSWMLGAFSVAVGPWLSFAWLTYCERE